MGHNIGANNISGHQPTDNCPSVSLIIPVFNAAEYIEECLRSIRSQSFHDFEVIIVDDGSSDGSIEIITDFCQKDCRFRLVKMAHGGVSIARNTGIDLSRGKHIGFVDADDCLYPDTVRLLVETLESTGAEVCVGGFKKGKDCKPSVIKKTNPTVMDYSTAMRKALYQQIILNAPWGMLMERRLLGDDIRFRVGTRYEDLDAFYRFYERADKIAYLPSKIYFYRQTEGSFMHCWHNNRLDALDVTDRIVEYMSKHHPDLLPAALDRQFSAHFNMLLLMSRLDVDDRQSIERCLKVINKNRVRELTDSNVRIKNKLGALASYGGWKFLKLLSKLNF